MNGRLGVICNRSDGERYGIKLDGSIKGILVKFENIREITSNSKLNIDRMSETSQDYECSGGGCSSPDCDECDDYRELPNPLLLSGILDGETMDPIIFSEHVKYMGDVNEVSIDTSTSNRNFWCLDPDCLESTEYFNSNEELDEHMKNHIE